MDPTRFSPSAARRGLRLLHAAAAATLAAAALSACAPLIVGGAAVGGALVATDRRTSGTQLEDKSIEVKAAGRIRDVLGERGHVNVNSYNRMVLLTGEVPSEADRAAAEQAAARVENVKGVYNELAVMGNSSLTSRSSDLLIQGKVKATLVDAKDLQSNAFEIVVERGIVYLLGRVTEREATRAVDLARSVGGVLKVVRVFEILTEAELAGTASRAAQGTPATPGTASPTSAPTQGAAGTAAEPVQATPVR
ncbi:MAG: BON domain-containing protein [Burkholderiales bacterium]|nr:BON domain-containing protein [Burkholderiales bacterium]